MKFTCSVQINAIRDKVVKLWVNPDHYKEWQTGFKSIETMEGEEGAVGSVSIVKFEHKGKSMELKETILTMDLPNEMKARYEHSHMVNTMHNVFEQNGDSTLYQAHIDYEKFIGFVPKMMAKLFPSMFRKQTQKWLDNFKEFVERNDQ